MAPETPKGVSSRLLTMKFMQRAAASASSSGSPDTDVPSSKKRKLDHSPAPGRMSASIDQATIQAALDDQEAKRQIALANHTAGDTHWVLNNTWDKSKVIKAAKATRKIVYVGYGEIASSDESGDNEDVPENGRTSTRKRKSSGKEKSAEQDGENSVSDDSSDGSSSEDENTSSKRKSRQSRDNSSSHSTPNRSRSHSRPGAESAKAKELREKRKKKEVRLNKITSISNGGDNKFGSQGSPNLQNMTCYNCQETGHRAADCPKKNSRGSQRKS